MMRSSIESLVKFPLQIPFETSVRSEKIIEATPANKAVNINEPTEANDKKTDKAKEMDVSNLLNGYIKYPEYDFF